MAYERRHLRVRGTAGGGSRDVPPGLGSLRPGSHGHPMLACAGSASSCGLCARAPACLAMGSNVLPSHGTGLAAAAPGPAGRILQLGLHGAAPAAGNLHRGVQFSLCRVAQVTWTIVASTSPSRSTPGGMPTGTSAHTWPRHRACICREVVVRARPRLTDLARRRNRLAFFFFLFSFSIRFLVDSPRLFFFDRVVGGLG